MYTSNNLTANQAAIAGKPAPTGNVGNRKIRLADKPRSPSRRTFAQTQKRHPKVPFLFSTDYRSSDQPASTAC
ncbi:hypothetical protein [Pseudomonas sp. TNT3]|uniref:hypothetical protein n=1 Tax=Pseudomonas sp. TNT3 TaxID=2654097 RepID=UPI001C498EB5|nr:hypothetical protein [Pseudomonas sp. TNT3]KAI2676467.1 hypothetical protein GBC55_020220 [Pseudomonas sp. TNT3]